MIIEGTTMVALYIAFATLTVLSKTISVMHSRGLFSKLYYKLKRQHKQLEESIKSKKTISMNGSEYLEVDTDTMKELFEITEDIIELISISKK